MASDVQIAANRRNAARSTGPRTAAGRARSSGNSKRHGMTAAGPDPRVADLLSIILGRPADLARASLDPQLDAAVALAEAEAALERVRMLQARISAEETDAHALRVAARYRAEAESRRRTAFRAWMTGTTAGKAEGRP